MPVKPLEVQISEDGKIALRMREPGATMQDIARPELVAQVRSRITAETPVVIAADGKVPYETVVKVMDELRTRHHPPGPAGGPVRRRQPARSREETLTRRSPAGSPARNAMTPPIIRHRSGPGHAAQH